MLHIPKLQPYARRSLYLHASYPCILALAARYKLKLSFGDVKTAFLNSPSLDREKELYAELPRGGVDGVKQGIQKASPLVQEGWPQLPQPRSDGLCVEGGRKL